MDKIRSPQPRPNAHNTDFKENFDLEIGYYVKSIDMFFKVKNSRGNNFKPTHWCYANVPEF